MFTSIYPGLCLYSIVTDELFALAYIAWLEQQVGPSSEVSFKYSVAKRSILSHRCLVGITVFQDAFKQQQFFVALSNVKMLKQWTKPHLCRTC